jgi:glutamyl-tRNA synthetase
VSLLSYKEQGYLPEALLNFLAQLAWTHPESKDIYSLDEMMNLFTWERVQKTGAIFGIDKMKWFNGQYIRGLSDEELALRLRDFTSLVYEDILRVVPLVKDRLVVLKEFDDLVAFVFEEMTFDKDLLIGKNQTAESTRMALLESAAVLAELNDWSQEAWEAAIRQLADKLGWKAGDLFMALRVAITFSKTSPPLRESMEVIGREQSLQRIQAAAQRLR